MSAQVLHFPGSPLRTKYEAAHEERARLWCRYIQIDEQLEALFIERDQIAAKMAELGEQASAIHHQAVERGQI